MIPVVCNGEMMGSVSGTARHPQVIHKFGEKTHSSWAEYKLDFIYLFIFNLQKLCVDILFYFLFWAY